MSDENEELPEIDDSVVAPGEAKKLESEVPSDDADAPDLGLIMDVPLRLSVELGSAHLPVREVLELARGSVVELDRTGADPADIYVNERLIARGELLTEDDRVAIRITEIMSARTSGLA
jgi:flagellar motor switch protein FliN/FliY